MALIEVVHMKVFPACVTHSIRTVQKIAKVIPITFQQGQTYHTVVIGMELLVVAVESDTEVIPTREVLLVLLTLY